MSIKIAKAHSDKYGRDYVSVAIGSAKPIWLSPANARALAAMDATTANEILSLADSLDPVVGANTLDLSALPPDLVRQLFAAMQHDGATSVPMAEAKPSLKSRAAAAAAVRAKAVSRS